MALPHLSAYSTRRNIYEAAIVRKRNHDNDFHERWSDTARFFDQSDVKATKQKAWESEASFNSSMDHWKAARERENKEINLKRRRLKLSELLKEERDVLQAELRGLSRDNYARIDAWKDRSETLRSAREERRKALAEELLYEHWRQNSPDLRKMEISQHKQHVIEGWGSQINEQKQREEKQKQEKEEYESKLEKERQVALELEQQREEERFSEEKKLADVLRNQIQELKSREAEASHLKAEQAALMQEQWALEQMESERKAREEERKKVEFGKVLLRQHAAALRRKSKQIQEELEEDRKFLERMMEEEQFEVAAQSARREKAAADVAWMKQVIEDQIRLEKTREAELDMLYQDEAARVWQQRESEWARERQARERLMREVMDERQQQVQQRIEQVHMEQQESLERREELVKDLEMANQLTQREQEDRNQAKETRRKEIEAQVTARRERDVAMKTRFAEELEDEKQAEDDYEEMLRKEAEQLKIRGYEPKTHVRKPARSAWM